MRRPLVTFGLIVSIRKVVRDRSNFGEILYSEYEIN